MNADRICARLWKAEMREYNLHFKSDYRQAFITVSLASRGEAEPFITASYRMYGIHPDKVWPRIVAERKAKLGREYDLWYFPDGAMRPDVIIPDYDPYVDTTRNIPDDWQDRFGIGLLPSSARSTPAL